MAYTWLMVEADEAIQKFGVAVSISETSEAADVIQLAREVVERCESVGWREV